MNMMNSARGLNASSIHQANRIVTSLMGKQIQTAGK